MPKNRPSVQKTNITAGPAVVYLGAAGSTPLVDIGWIKPDQAVQYEYQISEEEVRAGNPSLREFGLQIANDVEVTIPCGEWNLDLLMRALGSASTSTIGTATALQFGGEPEIDQVALLIEHRMAKAANTLQVCIWLAEPVGNLMLAFTEAVHTRTMKFKACRASTNWAGGALASGEELVRLLKLVP